MSSDEEIASFGKPGEVKAVDAANKKDDGAHFIPKRNKKSASDRDAVEHRFGYSEVDLELYSNKLNLQAEK